MKSPSGIERLRELIREALNESMQRHCEFYKATNGMWYMDLADKEYGDDYDSSTYGPFSSEEEAEKYLSDNFSNPGGWGTDDSGKRSVPKVSPNGSPVEAPRSRRDRYSYRY